MTTQPAPTRTRRRGSSVVRRRSARGTGCARYTAAGPTPPTRPPRSRRPSVARRSHRLSCGRSGRVRSGQGSRSPFTSTELGAGQVRAGHARVQGWNFGRFLVLLGYRRLYSLSGKYSPSIPFPIEPEIPGTQSTRLRPQFHTESLIGKPKILKRQTHGITTKAYRSA